MTWKVTTMPATKTSKRSNSKNKAKKRPSSTVLYFHRRTLADGTEAYGWSPSPRLRKLGYSFRDLGTDKPTALAAAERINEEVTRQLADPATGAPAPKNRAKVWTFAALLEDYYTQPKFTGLKPSTRKSYRIHANWLKAWAHDGATLVRTIDSDMCQSLCDTMLTEEVGDGTIVARMAILTVLMGHAESVKAIPKNSNPARGLDVPTPKSRTKRILIDTVRNLATYARERGEDELALGIELGFFTMQREGDLLDFQATPFTWLPLTNAAPNDIRTLAGDGTIAPRMMRLKQSKTKKWVDVPVTPELTRHIETELARQQSKRENSAYLLRDRRTGLPISGGQWQKMWREFKEIALDHYRASGDNWMVDQLTGLQYRDLRRSGMCWMRDLNVSIASIASLSGHKIEYTTKILDTYLPADTRASAAGIGEALRSQAALDAEIWPDDKGEVG